MKNLPPGLAADTDQKLAAAGEQLDQLISEWRGKRAAGQDEATIFGSFVAYTVTRSGMDPILVTMVLGAALARLAGEPR